jgi:uncharacterized protein
MNHIMLVAVALAIGSALGLVLALMGGGGAILAIPALVYLLHVDPRPAVAASLAAVGVGALSGLLGHARAGRVDWSLAARFGLAGALGALGGAWLNQRVPGERLLALLGLLMLAAAYLMANRPIAIQRELHSNSWWRPPVLGIAVGLLTGFFGVGGGFVIIPALTLGLGLPMRLAVGTSLAVIAVNSAAGLLGYIGSGAFDWQITPLVAAGSVAGGLIGSRLAGSLPEHGLRRGFAVLVGPVAVYLVYQNAAALVVVSAATGLVAG